MTKWIRFLSSFILFASFTMAVRDMPPWLVIGGFVLGAIGLVSAQLIDSYSDHWRFYRTVERYSTDWTPRYSAARRIVGEIRYALFVALILAVLVIGVVFAVLTTRFSFLTISFLVIMALMLVAVLKHVSAEKETWKEAATRLGLSYEFDADKQVPILSGSFRNRDVSVRLKRVSTLSGTGSYRPSKPGREISDFSSSSHLEEFTIVSAKAGVPESFRLSNRGGKWESDPVELSPFVLARHDIAERVKAISPFSTMELASSLLTLRWRGALDNVVEIEFLLNLACDVAEALESFARRRGSNSPSPQ